MEYNLTIDRGNSSVKASLFGSAEPAEPWRTAMADSVDEAVAAVMAGLADGQVSGAIYASVAEAAGSMAPRALRRRFRHVVVMDAATPVPLQVDYAPRESLGVDRLAGAVGACVLYPGRRVMTVDAGSAVTYDLVAAEGVYCGGVIAPGVGMRLRALNAFTARLPRLEARDLQGAALPPDCVGHTTAQAMLIGAAAGVRAEIGYYRAAWRPEIILLTGGHAALLRESFADLQGAILAPDLVGIGLNKILTDLI